MRFKLVDLQPINISVCIDIANWSQRKKKYPRWRKCTLYIWMSENLWESVNKIHWISVNIAPLKKFSPAILTEIQWIFSESQRLSQVQILECDDLTFNFLIRVFETIISLRNQYLLQEISKYVSWMEVKFTISILETKISWRSGTDHFHENRMFFFRIECVLFLTIGVTYECIAERDSISQQ